MAERQTDYKALWETLKADLDRWNQVGGFDKPDFETEEMWELMQRREEQS